MSVRMMARVWDLRGLTSSERLVALKFADCANDPSQRPDGQALAYPKLGTVAFDCELSERAVRYAVRSLEDKGVLALLRRATGRDAACYRMFPPVLPGETRGATVAPLSPDERGNHCPPEPGREGQPLPPTTRTRGANGDSEGGKTRHRIKDDPSNTPVQDPPYPPQAGGGALRGLLRHDGTLTREGRRRAEETRRRCWGRCPHDPTCQTLDECLVAIVRSWDRPVESADACTAEDSAVSEGEVGHGASVLA